MVTLGLVPVTRLKLTRQGRGFNPPFFFSGGTGFSSPRPLLPQALEQLSLGSWSLFAARPWKRKARFRALLSLANASPGGGSQARLRLVFRLNPYSRPLSARS